MTLDELSSQAEMHFSSGHFRDAMPLYERLLEICEKDGGLEHPSSAAIFSALGRTYYSLGMYEQAETVYRRLLVILERVMDQSIWMWRIILSSSHGFCGHKERVRRLSPYTVVL
jgi:tetratricopeptide (TPR) repeat protein